MCHSKKSVPVMLQEVARMLDLLHKLGVDYFEEGNND